MKDLNRLQNEIILAKMQKKNKGRYTPWIAFASTILTSIIIVSWTLFVV